MSDTIYALSSGAPPAAIAILRVSGPRAADALRALAGMLPEPRRATLAFLRDVNGEPLDRALLLWMPGPNSVTGEDLAEFHCHGGRAVVSAIEEALGALPLMRRAEPGEFTRRAFVNGRMDLNAVEGLADLLAAETQGQRRAALMMAEGHFSRRIDHWRERLLTASAMVEAALDFSDEDDVPALDIEERIAADLRALAAEIETILTAPSAERLRDGIRVVIAGPPNAGKSTLLNALAGRDAAIVSDIAGTTRDRIEVPTAIGGIAFLLTDTAGLREQGADTVERIGMERARAAMEAADILLWLGEPADMPKDALLIAAQSDRADFGSRAGLTLSAVTGEGMDRLHHELQQRAAALLPADGAHALHARQRDAVGRLHEHVQEAARIPDLLIAAEELRAARAAIDALTGRAGTEDMLDRLFAGFCIGK